MKTLKVQGFVLSRRSVLLAGGMLGMLSAVRTVADEPTQPPTLEETLAWLQRLPDLKGLPAGRFAALTKADLKALAELRLGGHRVSDGKHIEIPGPDFRYLTALPALATAKLTEVDGLDDTAFRHLGRIPSLVQLEAGDAQVTAAGLKHLLPLRKLKHLNLAFARQVGDAGMPTLAKLTGLEVLVLSGTAVTDAGLVEIARLPYLAELRIKATAVTDAGLLHLRGARALKMVRISPQQKITPAGISELQKALPDCVIGP